MSLKDLPNPKAAAEAIAAFQKRYRTKVCLAPHEDHEGVIVSAHTISSGPFLSKIATASHVYAIHSDLASSFTTDHLSLRKKGIAEVSVFNGFCAKHDRDIFSCIENEPLSFRPDQCFVLAFRAVAREAYGKRRQYESLLDSWKNFKEIYNHPDIPAPTDIEIIYTAANLQGAKDIEKIKTTLDGYLLSQSWRRIQNRIFIFKKSPVIASSFVFAPVYDLNSNKLQDFHNLESEVSHLMVNVIPLERGGAAIFSWLDTANSSPRRFVDSLQNSNDITSSIIELILISSDNIAIAPEWYDSLNENEKQDIISLIQDKQSNLFYATRDGELKTSIRSDWQQEHIFDI